MSHHIERVRVVRPAWWPPRHDNTRIVVFTPVGAEMTPAILSRIEAFLATRYPGYVITLEPPLAGGDHGFVAIPVLGRMSDGEDPGVIYPDVDVATLNAIADALGMLEADGWRVPLH